jgi:hypothetical protein
MLLDLLLDCIKSIKYICWHIMGYKQNLKGQIAIINNYVDILDVVYNLVDRNIHLILFVDDNSFSRNYLTLMIQNYIVKQKSTSKIQTINNSDIYKYNINDYVNKMDDNSSKSNVDILILNHQNKKSNEPSAIILRQVIPGMISQMYGKIIYINSHGDSDSDNHNDNNNDNDSDSDNKRYTNNETKLNTLSICAQDELIENNIKITHINNFNNKQKMGNVISTYLDYDILCN